MTRVKAIVFDRDGVLTDFDLDAAAAFFQRLLPLSLQEMNERWEAWGNKVGFPRSAHEEHEFFRSFWTTIGDELELPETVCTQLIRFDYTSCMRAFPDARPALIATRRRNLRAGVLSNFSLASLDASLQATGLADLVDIACAAPVIGFSKPEQEAYLTVARALGVEPQECLLFDDELPCVEGARELGIQAYLVDRRRAQHAINDGIVCDLSALPEIFQLVALATGE